MPALPTGIVTQLTGGTQTKPRLKQAYLVALLEGQPDVPPWANFANNIPFQYWPETISDTRPAEWNPRAIPGGSHPIYQWTHSGERRITFTSLFTNDFEIEDEGHGEGGLIDSAVNSLQTAATTIGLAGTPEPPGAQVRKVDVAAAISWMRWFTYPYYDPEDVRVYEPAKCLLVLPGSNIGFDGSDSITCVMTNCDVTYQAFFVNGKPRIAEVSLGFAEVIQRGDRVRFHSRDLMTTSARIPSYLSLNEENSSTSVAEDIAGSISGAFGL